MANTETKLNLQGLLRDWQLKAFKEIDKKKYSVLVVSRRSGKTILTIIYLIYRALKTPDRDLAYIAPFLNQARSISWEYLKKFAAQIPWTEINNTELKVKFANGSSIRVFGADNSEALRGLNISWAVLDEYANINKELYGAILFPMINYFEDGFAIFIWTPKWYDDFYELYQKAKNDTNRFSLKLDVIWAWVLSEEGIREAREQISPSQYAQEYLCDFGVAIKWSYYWEYISDMRNEWRVVDDLYDNSLAVYTYWDIGVNDQTAILFIQYKDGEARIIDYFEDRQRWLEYYIDVISERWYRYDYHTLPWDWTVKEWWTWMTRLEQFQEKIEDKNIGEVRVAKRQPIEDWIQAVRMMLPNTRVDSTLDNELSRLSLYESQYDPKKWTFWKPKHDKNSHLADTFRYAAFDYKTNSIVIAYEPPFTVNYDTFI